MRACPSAAQPTGRRDAKTCSPLWGDALPLSAALSQIEAEARDA